MTGFGRRFREAWPRMSPARKVLTIVAAPVLLLCTITLILELAGVDTGWALTAALTLAVVYSGANLVVASLDGGFGPRGSA